MNQLINDEAVYRTAPATPGLLIGNIYRLPFSNPPYGGGAELYFGGLLLMDHSDHHRVKYFCEAPGFKYHFGYPCGVPRPPLPLTPLDSYRGGGGPMWPGGGL